MPSKSKNPKEYIESLPEDRKVAVSELRKVIRKNLPKGFSEDMCYGMLTQKHFIAVYHMGMYADKKLLDWFTAEFPKYTRMLNWTSARVVSGSKNRKFRFNLLESLPLKLHQSSGFRFMIMSSNGDQKHMS